MGIFSVFKKKRPSRYKFGRYTKRPGRRVVLTAINKKIATRAVIVCMTLVGISLIGHLAYKGLCQSVFFRLTAITIEGCQQLSKEQVLELSGVDIQTNLLAVSIGEIEKNIKAHGWVKEATVARNWPNELFIRIKERKAVAMINFKKELSYLDKNFDVIGPVEPKGDIDFPVITGFEEISGSRHDDGGRAAALHDALIIVKEAGRGNSFLPCQNISEIHVTVNNELVLYLLDEVFPIYLGRDTMKRKYWRLVKILKGLYKSGEISRIDHIRMDYMQDKALVSRIESGVHTRG
jgi:cell division protein FtsQ